MKTTEEKKRQIQMKAQKELTRLSDIYNNPDKKREINDFKNKYLFCEIAYKTFLEEYLYQKTKRRPNALRVNMNQVPTVLKFAGHEIEKELLSKLFGSEKRVGIRTVKKLRDDLTHKVSKRAVDELYERKEELYDCMNSFLKII